MTARRDLAQIAAHGRSEPDPEHRLTFQPQSASRSTQFRSRPVAAKLKRAAPGEFLNLRIIFDSSDATQYTDLQGCCQGQAVHSVTGRRADGDGTVHRQLAGAPVLLCRGQAIH
jgi:hypothetical protein